MAENGFQRKITITGLAYAGNMRESYVVTTTPSIPFNIEPGLNTTLEVTVYDIGFYLYENTPKNPSNDELAYYLKMTRWELERMHLDIKYRVEGESKQRIYRVELADLIEKYMIEKFYEEEELTVEVFSLGGIAYTDIWNYKVSVTLRNTGNVTLKISKIEFLLYNTRKANTSKKPIYTKEIKYFTPIVLKPGEKRVIIYTLLLRSSIVYRATWIVVKVYTTDGKVWSGGNGF